MPSAEAQMALRAPASQREPLIGQYVGDYLVVALLGKGGFGKVLLGLQRPMYRLRAAIKLLELHDKTDARMGQRMAQKFESEAEALAVLQHPNIVRLLQFGSFQDRAYIAMEYVPGSRTLQTEINRFVVSRAALDPDTIKHVLTQVLNGLEAAHDQDIIHRDIKPENIMLQVVVGDSWHVKLVDFGLAKVVSESRETSVVLGTVHYMAPEQVEAKNLGPWTDLYAVAAIAFELMTGHRAFAGKEMQEILRQKLNPQYDPFARIGPHDLSPLIVDFLRKGLARHPRDRFQSTSQMREALHGMFAEAPLTMQFSRDLSALMDSGELREEERRLRDERRALDVDRQQLELERRALASERLRISSASSDSPIVLEHAGIGPTIALPGAVGFRDALLMDTGVPPTIAPPVPPTQRPRWPLWAGAIAVVAAGATAALLSGATTTPAPTLIATETKPRAAALEPIKPQAPTVPPSQPAAVIAAPEVVPPEVGTPEVTAPTVVSTSAAVPGTISNATIEIESTPSKARVFVDGKLAGSTPYRLETERGTKHKLELELPGYTRATRELEATLDRTQLDIALTPKPARTPKPPPEATPPALPDPPPIKPLYIDD